MKRVLFIQNGDSDHPGLFATVLRECGITLDVIHPWRGEVVPRRLDEWAGVAVGGGSMSAFETDEYPWLKDAAAIVQTAQAEGKPALGMCLGAQVMAGAFGGRVSPNHSKEIGFYEVHFTPAAEEDALWAGQTQSFKPVHWHGDTFSLPPRAELLASSALTENQLFRLGPLLYGFQFHLEIDEPVLTEMVMTDDEGWLLRNGVNPQEFLREATTALPQAEPIARSVFKRWVGLLS